MAETTTIDGNRGLHKPAPLSWKGRLEIAVPRGSTVRRNGPSHTLPGTDRGHLAAGGQDGKLERDDQEETREGFRRKIP